MRTIGTVPYDPVLHYILKTHNITETITRDLRTETTDTDNYRSNTTHSP